MTDHNTSTERQDTLSKSPGASSPAKIANWRPQRHAYIPDADGNCTTCGYGYSFGGLHHDEPLTDDDPAPRLCSCGHFEHRGVCWGAIPAFPEPKPCQCGAA